MIVDTHCHLYDQVFAERKAEVESNALAAGVGRVLLPNVNSASLDTMDAVVGDYPQLQVGRMVGLHPCYVKEGWEEELATIKAHYLASPESYCAVGEIGMDLYWDTSTLDIQIQALNEQLDWAVEWDLPVALHVRSSFKELFPVLEAAQEKHNGKLRGVFHCFSGGKKQIKRALRLGEFYFGIGGSYTYNRSATDVVISTIPSDRLLLETDAPYLTPSAFKGQKNEPGFLLEVVKVASEALKCTTEEVIALTEENATKLFGAHA